MAPAKAMEIQPKMTKWTCTGRMRPKCSHGMSLGKTSGQARRIDVAERQEHPDVRITMDEKKKCFAAVPSA